jgi:hypothetical protein
LIIGRVGADRATLGGLTSLGVRGHGYLKPWESWETDRLPLLPGAGKCPAENRIAIFRTVKLGFVTRWWKTFLEKDLFVFHIMSMWNIKLETEHLWDPVPVLSAATILKLTSGSEGRGSHPVLFSVSPQRNNFWRCSLSAMSKCSLTLISQSPTWF